MAKNWRHYFEWELEGDNIEIILRGRLYVWHGDEDGEYIYSEAQEKDLMLSDIGLLDERRWELGSFQFKHGVN